MLDSISGDTTCLEGRVGGANIGVERATNLDVRRKYQRRILPGLDFLSVHTDCGFEARNTTTVRR
jgi:hypothetical protein